MTREQVLGLEIILAHGTILPSLNKTLKNHSGYDLKHLSRSEPEIALMRTLKRSLDPGNILNPGKVVDTTR